jgi:hypothetical protein
MVKNESANLRATLESCASFADEIVVLDTGSTDGTQEIAKEFIAKRSGALYERPFENFSASRNFLLDLCEQGGTNACSPSYIVSNNHISPAFDVWKPCVFTLMLNGDEVLESTRLREELEKVRDAPDGAYCVTMQTRSAEAGGMVRQWPYTRILRVDAKWRYEGGRHERPVGPNREVDGPLLPGVVVVHRESDPARKLKRMQEDDLPHFTKIVGDESLSLEQRAHAIFFLAETHAAIGGMICKRNERGLPVIDGGPFFSHQLAAMALYMRYAMIAEQPDREAYDPNKVHYALTLYHMLAEQVGIYQPLEMAQRMEAIVSVAPNQPEARFLLARAAMRVDVRKGLFHAIAAAKVAHAAKENPTREVTEASLEWRCWHMAAACAQQLKNEQQAADLMKRAIAAGAPKELLKLKEE